jgi:AsmA protein
MKRLALIAGGIIGLLLVAALALPFLIDPNRFRPMLEEKLSQALAREVKLGDLKLSILSGTVNASNLSISDNPAFSKGSFVEAKSLGVGVEVWPLITSHQLHVTGLTIDQPSITLIQSNNGDWNFSNLGGNAPAQPKAASESSSKSDLDLSVKLVKITGGRFSLGHTAAHSKPLVLEDVNVEVKDFSVANAFPFSFSAKVGGGGTIKLDGQAGPVNMADTSASPFQVNLKMDQLDLAGTGLTQNTPAIAGLISLDGSCTSDGKTAQLKTKLRGDKLKLAKEGTPAKKTVELDFATNHDLRKRSGHVTQGDVHLGGAVAHLTGTYAEEGEATTVHMALDAPKMPVPELEAFLPALAVSLPRGSTLQGGTASMKLSMDGVTAKLVTSGTVSLDNTKLAGFDLGRKMAVIETLAGIKASPDTDIQTFNSAFKVTPEGTTAENIQLIVPSIGNLDGNGTVSPSDALDFKMRATLHSTAIPFTVVGTTADPVIRPDMKAAIKQEAGKAATGLLKGLLGGGKK